MGEVLAVLRDGRQRRPSPAPWGCRSLGTTHCSWMADMRTLLATMPIALLFGCASSTDPHGSPAATTLPAASSASTASGQTSSATPSSSTLRPYPRASRALPLSRAGAESFARRVSSAAPDAPTFSEEMSGADFISRFNEDRREAIDESRPVWVVTVKTPVRGDGIVPTSYDNYNIVIDAVDGIGTDDCLGCDWLSEDGPRESAREVRTFLPLAPN